MASINDDGSPAVSPKATFVIVDNSTIAFGDIRSPNTVNNLSIRPLTEINFIDILHRRALRIKGHAFIVEKHSGKWAELEPIFSEFWGPYLNMMVNFVGIRIENVDLVTSPAYDIGATADQLKLSNLGKLNDL
ncbi:MAG: pyridoxamine 5'-phosphate oxidase family protein [Gammaproteobacteria bacterium]|nr:pyridoxamine 5'-phosphate oxidase family protein [Gammaproteobacteria bacterium]